VTPIFVPGSHPTPRHKTWDICASHHDFKVYGGFQATDRFGEFKLSLCSLKAETPKPNRIHVL